MSDERTLKSNSYLVQGLPFLYLVLEFVFYQLYELNFLSFVRPLILKIKEFFIFQDGNILYSHTVAFFLVLLASIGTKPKRSMNISIGPNIAAPIMIGMILFYAALYFYYFETDFDPFKVSNFALAYFVLSIVGAVIIQVGADNISKLIRVGFMNDKFNMDNESFEQPSKPIITEYSLNLPMEYYHKKKQRKGWFNLTNPFRATMVIGTPESGKTFSIIVPFLKNFISKAHTTITYDYKYPSLTDIAYYEHLKNKRNPEYKHKFHVICLHDVAYSKRVNPLDKQYLDGLPDCMETAEALVQSLQKTATSSGSDKFFQLSAINFLAAIFFFLLRFENGKYSTLPHALSLINRSYDEIFSVLLTMPELDNIMAPFKSAHVTKTYGQLEGQIGTLRVSLSPLATPELFWVLSSNDFDLRISSRESPSHLVIANSTKTESINAASNALLLNRLIKLLNTPGNLPSAVVVDELPTIYFHKIQNLMATARSNKVAVMLGLQELPQLIESYGRDVAATVTSVVGNLISGQARKKETLDWLQQIFGKVKQMKAGVSVNMTDATTSFNENMDFLIPASKIADQRTGEIVAKLAFGFNEKSSIHNNLNTYNCRIKIDVNQVKKEEENYQPLPIYYPFENKQHVEQTLRDNMNSIKADIEYIVQTVQ